MKEALTIFVPVYNEEENLERLCSALLSYIEARCADREICALLVDDGSSDSSLELMRRLCDGRRLRYVSFDTNRGLSAAMKAAFDLVTTPLLAYVDADLQTTPEDLDLLLPWIEEYPLVCGCRKQRKDKALKRISSRIGNAVRNHFTHDGVADTNCPLKLMRTSLARRIPMFKGMHRFLPALAMMLGCKVKVVEVRHFPRIAGKSKFGVLNRLAGPLADCFAVRWMRHRWIDYTIREKSELK